MDQGTKREAKRKTSSVRSTLSRRYSMQTDIAGCLRVGRLRSRADQERQYLLLYFLQLGSA